MRLLSIDPGLSSGLALGRYSEIEPYTLVTAWQVPNGVSGIIRWLADNSELEWDDWVCERFVPISHSGFNLTLASVESLAVEGALMARGIIDRNDTKRMQRPQAMYLFGGKTLPEKKKLARKFLKDTGNYVMPKVLGTKDNNDAVSATLHGISYVMKVLGNRPTFEMVSGWDDSRVVNLAQPTEQGN